MKQLVCVAAGTCLAASLVACGGGSPGAVTNAMPPAGTAPGVSWTYSVLHEFTDYPPSQLDGASPTGPLISDAGGALYGTTQLGGSTGSCGTVFKLAPSGSGYTETILHVFPSIGTPPVCGAGADGWSPPWGVYMDAHGALYGTTEYGGAGCGSKGCGVVFKLTPSSSGYAETILHYFQGQPDGANPRSGVVADAQGALYGTTTVGGANNAGAVYKLKPSGSGYKESVIFSFGGASGFGYYPNYGNLLLGKDGKVIYGTWQDNYYYGNGGVFALTLTKSRYAGRILYAFKGTPDGKGPWGTLVAGSKGIMYGVTAYGGRGSPYWLRSVRDRVQYYDNGTGTRAIQF